MFSAIIPLFVEFFQVSEVNRLFRYFLVHRPTNDQSPMLLVSSYLNSSLNEEKCFDFQNYPSLSQLLMIRGNFSFLSKI